MRSIRLGGLVIGTVAAVATPVLLRAQTVPATSPKPDALPKPMSGTKSPMSAMPPFLGLFGSADLIAKTGFRGHIGSYVEFREETRSGENKGGMRITQVGPETPGARWIEMTTVGTTLANAGVRMLARGVGTGNIERLIVQSSQGIPFELPLRSLTSDMPMVMPGAPPGTTVLTQVKHIGREKVTVPIGTFMTEHWLVATTPKKLEFWTTGDEKIPFIGLVKMGVDDGIAVATKVGTDANPSIPLPPSALP